jgi:fatty-acyl-CoA synthase/long-chain acyl-CoA synthetase
MIETDAHTRTLKSVFEKSLRKYADRVAVQFENESLTYAELDARANAFAQALTDHDVGPNDRVALMLTNRVEYLIADLGVIKAGATKVPLNDQLTAAEFEYMLNDSRAGTVVCGPAFTDTVDDLRPSLDHVETFVGVTDGKSLPEGFVPFEEFTGEAPAPPETVVEPSDFVGHYYTGGTTGKPKGVLHTHENMMVNAYSHIIELGITADDTMLLMTPLPHSAGAFLWAGLLAGATVVVRDGFDIDVALSTIENESVTWTFMVPTMIYRVLDSPQLSDHDTSSLDTLVYGAAPMTPARLREGLGAFGPVFLQFYGQTEVPNLITTFGKQEHQIAVERDQTDRLSSAGQACLMSDVKIVDVETGEELPHGEEGEVLSTAPYTMESYHERPEATEETVTDGWVRTGDIGRIDEDGYVYLLDRASDMIITGGMNVYSTEVEESLGGHDDIKEVAVIGIPDEEWGEIVTAICVRRDEATLTASDVFSFANEQLADYKKPKRVEFVDEIPKTPYGKMDKKALRNEYWKGEDREIS